MEVDKGKEDVSTIPFTKEMTTKEVGEVERSEEEDIHLNGLELLFDPNDSVLQPISLDT